MTPNESALLLRRATNEDLPLLLALQTEAAAEMTADGRYFPVTQTELFESIQHDTVLCIWEGAHLAAFARLLHNRACKESLAHLTAGAYTCEQLVTLDAVAVHPHFRGRGLQRTLIGTTEALARALGATAVAATVSPENEYSLTNFRAASFAILGERLCYGGLRRLLLAKALSK